MEFLGYYFSTVELILTTVLFIAFVHQLYFYFRYMTVICHVSKNREPVQKTDSSGKKPPVSVIVIAQNEGNCLTEYLPRILEQDYPSFEVIVVNNASDDDTELAIRALKTRYPQLKSTFVPTGTKNICSRKLAITLGVKAAQHDVLLFTNANCYPQSNQWIARMASHFESQTEFVLGCYSNIQPEHTTGSRLFAYDALFFTLQCMGLAWRGKAYTGHEQNLALRKETFSRMKGFSAGLNISSRDNAMLVGNGSSPTNTAIETTPDGSMCSAMPIHLSEWLRHKAQHRTDFKQYRTNVRFTLGSEISSRILFYLSLPFLGAFGCLPSMGFALLLFLIRYSCQCHIVNKTARLCDSKRRYFLTIPLFDLSLPFFSCAARFFGNSKNEVHW